MYVKLFYAFDMKDLEDQMNDFLEGRKKEDILDIDIKTNLTYNQTQEDTHHYLYGIVSFEGSYE